MGSPGKILKLIKNLYENPCFNVKDGKNESTKRRQSTGIRQGCPLSPYLFIILLTAIIRDIRTNLTEEEKRILDNGKLHKVEQDSLFYADDTVIMTTTADAAQMVLHKIQEESAKYNLKLNQTKCCLLRLNAVQTVQYQIGRAHV